LGKKSSFQDRPISRRNGLGSDACKQIVEKLSILFSKSEKNERMTLFEWAESPGDLLR
jgi:hypothetical protein